MTSLDPLAVATRAARDAGALLLDYLKRPRTIETKSRRADLVTDADRASEALIIEQLQQAFPQSSILGEETGSHAGTSSEFWYVDPLDGTTNYAHGYPFFCVSIAYERGGELCAAVVYAPFYDELFAARLGGGATLNGQPLRVSAIDQVGDALTCTGFHPDNFSRNGAYFATMSGHAQAVRRDGSAALDLANVAAGRFDGFWEFDLRPWDVAAGALLVREAGGTVSTIDGSGFSVAGSSILATNRAIHDEMTAILGSVAPR